MLSSAKFVLETHTVELQKCHQKISIFFKAHFIFNRVYVKLGRWHMLTHGSKAIRSAGTGGCEPLNSSAGT